jgi:internalin A
VIRSDFERIHRDISNLQPEQMVPIPDFPNVAISYEKLLAMERCQIKSFPEFVHKTVINLDVIELLNGVDLEGTRTVDPTDVQENAAKLFISYSHKDDHLRQELENHLKIIQRKGLVHSWSDRRIVAGEEWKREIDDNLEQAEIILLLISSDFIASDYCYEKEMMHALSRERNGEVKVIPIIVRDVNWRNAPFAKLQALPIDGKAVELWEHKDSAWRNVSEGIERVLEGMLRSKTALT